MLFPLHHARALCLFLLSVSALPATDRRTAVAQYSQLPLSFEPNRGQTDSSVKYVARGSGYTLLLGAHEAILRFVGPPSATVHLRFAASRSNPKIEALDPLPGRTNYFIGSNSKDWVSDVPQYSKVRYSDVYPGISLIYYGNQRQLEYDLVLAPGVDSGAIALEVTGGGKLTIDSHGDVVLGAKGHRLRLKTPDCYQISKGERQSIASRYVLKSPTKVMFELERYDKTKALVIDPSLIYSTYFGGSGDDDIFGLAVLDGNAYITGCTSSLDFPLQKAFQSKPAHNTRAFVSKFDADGAHLLYSTYLGGSGYDCGGAIALDRLGNAYVTGETSSSDFPTLHAIQTRNLGSLNAFVTKLNSKGDALVYSTYLGGSQGELGGAIAVDRRGNAYVAGDANSADFPIKNALQSHSAGSQDVFLAKLSETGQELVYSTYLGGSGEDGPSSIQVDSEGAVYLTGFTASLNFPVKQAAQPSYGGGLVDAFVTKISPDGSSLVFSTYLGGSGEDEGSHLIVDPHGDIYIAGDTASINFPISPHAFQPVYGGGEVDAFITKLSRDGGRILSSTYLGGSQLDQAIGIALNERGGLFVAGRTESPDFPVTRNAIQSRLAGQRNTFVSTLDQSLTRLGDFSTYLGGGQLDQPWSFAVDEWQNLYVGGLTTSTRFPLTPAAFQKVNRGGLNNADGFLYKLRYRAEDEDGRDDKK